MGRAVRLLALLTLLGAAIVAGGAWWAWRAYTEPGPLTKETAVIVLPGASTATIAESLADAGVISDPLLFRTAVRVEGLGNALRAGEFAFPPGVSARGAAEILRSASPVVRRVTIPEGLTSQQIMGLLRETQGLYGERLETPAEGTLLPETYHYAYGDGRHEVVERMTDAMDKALAELWDKRAADLPLATPKEALILASIVERESAVPEERPRVAAVFLNRLRRGMPLQADPTVIYAVSDGRGTLPRPLTRKDLETQSPYNTYTNPGLPPGPIANPGRASLEAVLNPAETNELYFVADGSGGHAFATTLKEHNRNVRRWRRLQERGEAEGLAPASSNP